jgi:GntR family transcriptional regulator, transcriptional repressor for pyruvate dehydrogenase complex
MAHDALRRLKVVRPKRIYEQIAEQIETLVRDGTFAPGARLPGERELAEMLGVSRPSLREALIALETAGLIETRIGDGTYVRTDLAGGRVFPLSGRDMGPGPLEQFEARRAVECAAAELAATRADAEDRAVLSASLARMRTLVASGTNPADEHRVFHVRLGDASRNGILAGAVRELWRLRQEPMWDLLRRKVENPASWNAGIAFRSRLMDAIDARDGAAARREMETHFDRVGRMYFDPKE